MRPEHLGGVSLERNGEHYFMLLKSAERFESISFDFLVSSTSHLGKYTYDSILELGSCSTCTSERPPV